jgi:hypothetical protein
MFSNTLPSALSEYFAFTEKMCMAKRAYRSEGEGKQRKPKEPLTQRYKK